VNVYAVHIERMERTMINRPWLFTLTFLAFPPAGLLARAVAGPVGSIGAALLGGAIVGVVVGAAQWLVLRSSVRPWWIAATAAAISAALAITTGLGLLSTDRADLLAIGVITGLVLGAAQGVLMPPRLRLLWAAAVAVLWPVAWQVTALVGVDLTQGWAVFGASGALVLSVSLAALLAAAGRRARVEVAA
jgi:hypothetical protein